MSGSNRGIVVATAVFAIALALVIARSGGPAPKAADAPSNEFSATRAANTLHAINGDTPHPVGSDAHNAVRDRLAARFRALGYDVAVQRRFACNAHGVCAPVENLIARAPGQTGTDELLVAAHYDSVPAGPGTSDDGLGVGSVIEVARAVRTQHFKNSVVFLVTDGEEAGLLGAEGFVADADAAKRVAAVINVDSRGTSGASFMFETSRHNRWLIPIVARELPRPATSSLYFNIYELLPNDTDMTVFKRAGFAGVNFANIGGVVHYHTPLDSFANLSLPLLQHDGDHVLAMLRALGDADLRQTSDQNAVWFDVLSLFIVWWPQGLTLWLTVLSLAMIITAAALRIREEETTARAITAGVMMFFAALLAPFLIAVIINYLTIGASWAAHPQPMIIAMWLLGASCAIAAAKFFYRAAGVDGLFLGVGLCWSVVAVALLIALPGGSYLALIPALAMSICAILRAIIDLDDLVIIAVVGAITCVLFFPVAISFYTALGATALPVIALVVALVMTTFAPAFASAPASRAIATAAFAIAVVLAIVGKLLPAYSPESPKRLNVRYVVDGTSSKWQADAMTPQLRNAAPFGKERTNIGPWYRDGWNAYEAPAPAVPLQPVEARVVSDQHDGAKRTLVVAVHSARNAPRIALVFRTNSLSQLRINGAPLPPRTARFSDPIKPDWHRVFVRGASDVQVEITVGDSTPVEVVAFDSSFGLPPQAAPLIAARNGSLCVPSDDGDMTQTFLRTKF